MVASHVYLAAKTEPIYNEVSLHTILKKAGGEGITLQKKIPGQSQLPNFRPVEAPVPATHQS